MSDIKSRQYLLYLSNVLLLLMLTSCALFPDADKRAEMMTLPELDKTLASARQNLPGSDQWPVVDWWTIFAMPKLSDLIETAVRDNPKLKEVAARLQQSQSLVDVQAAEQYPTVHANVSFRARRFSANGVQAKFAGENFRELLINPLVLRYHLDLWEKDEAALQAAIGRAMAAEMEQVDARLLLSAAVAQAYFDLAITSDELKFEEQILVCHERLLRMNKVLFASGLIAQDPLLSAEVELHNVQQQVSALRTQVALQQNILAVLAGKGPDWGRDIVASFSVLPEKIPLPSDLPLHLLAHRPDLQATRLQVEAAAQEIKVAETEFYPDVNLVSFVGLHSVSMTDILLEGSSLAYAVGPSITFPIFEGGRLRANLDYQEAAYDEAAYQYNSQLLHAVKDVADTLARWQDIDARLTEQQQGLAAMQKKLRLAEVKVKQGLSDQSDLLQMQVAEYQQRLFLSTLQGEYLKAAVQVIRALGGGYSKNEEVCEKPCKN